MVKIKIGNGEMEREAMKAVRFKRECQIEKKLKSKRKNKKKIICRQKRERERFKK